MRYSQTYDIMRNVKIMTKSWNYDKKVSYDKNILLL